MKVIPRHVVQTIILFFYFWAYPMIILEVRLAHNNIFLTFEHTWWRLFLRHVIQTLILFFYFWAYLMVILEVRLAHNYILKTFEQTWWLFQRRVMHTIICFYFWNVFLSFFPPSYQSPYFKPNLETFKKILTINKQTNKYFIVNQDAPKNRKIIINLLQWLAWFKWFSNIEIK
jgi:hypothetical protein